MLSSLNERELLALEKGKRVDHKVPVIPNGPRKSRVTEPSGGLLVMALAGYSSGGKRDTAVTLSFLNSIASRPRTQSILGPVTSYSVARVNDLPSGPQTVSPTSNRPPRVSPAT